MGHGNPVGEVLYHAIRIEFQFRGSPHGHCFIWIKDFPTLSDENIEMFVKVIDKHVSASLPDSMECPVLHNLVRSYQTHTHSKTCRKYKNIACRFNFGHFFTERTIIAKPLHCDVDKDEKKIVLKKKRSHIKQGERVHQ